MFYDHKIEICITEHGTWTLAPTLSSITPVYLLHFLHLFCGSCFASVPLPELPYSLQLFCVFLHPLFPNSHLCYKSEHCASVITSLRAVLEPMTYETRHCVDTNESQSACGNQLGDRLIPSPPFSVREQETNTEKRTPAVLPVPKHFSLKSAPAAEKLGSIFSLCSLVYQMHV